MVSVSGGFFLTVVVRDWAAGASQAILLHSQAGVTTTTLKLIARAATAGYEVRVTVSLSVCVVACSSSVGSAVISQVSASPAFWATVTQLIAVSS